MDSSTNAGSPPRLLIVDDEVAQMRALCDTLTTEGYSTAGYSSAKQALGELADNRFDLLLTDLMMPELDGIELLTAARTIDPQMAGIIMTGHGTIDTAVAAMQVGALDYILKPFKLNVLLPVLARALELRRLRLENAELHQRERQSAAELAASYHDLELFSFSVSHDLRAPLHIIRGFCDAYMADFGEGIPDEGRQMLEHVTTSAKRMDQLIADLLTFCRFSRQPLEKRPVQLEPFVHQILAELQTASVLGNAQPIDVQVGQLGDCEADPSLLQQVFVNLLSNALKFTRGRSAPRIEVGCVSTKSDSETDVAAEHVYFVRDNGAGFDMQKAAKLFGVFQRLHSQQDFEGTGVGLSIVQRIIQRHGGRVWAESQVDHGATFFFTVPAA